MSKSEYTIIDDFQVKNVRVLVLDSNYEFHICMLHKKIWLKNLQTLWSLQGNFS